MKKDNELHLRCSCHSHELHVEKDHADDIEWWYISFWQRGYITETPWKYKLKCIWHILRNGRPYGDEVILEKKDLLELKQYLEEQLK